MNAASPSFGGGQVEETVHRLDRVQQALVHVDVDHLGTVLDLLDRDTERGVVIACFDQAPKARRAGDIGALTDIDEDALGGDVARLETGQPARRLDLGCLAGC